MKVLKIISIIISFVFLVGCDLYDNVENVISTEEFISEVQSDFEMENKITTEILKSEESSEVISEIRKEADVDLVHENENKNRIIVIDAADSSKCNRIYFYRFI